LQASKKALTTAVVDVASLVYGEKCPKAVNQMKVGVPPWHLPEAV
jgi:hypothetical protein